MKLTKIIVLILLVCLVPTNSFAKKTHILRGGFGFLFPDHNSFANPGQFAITHGAAFEASYSQASIGSVKGLNSSFVLGKGKWGMGVFGSRVGTAIDSPATSADVVGGGIGFSILKERMTLGVSYVRSIDVAQTSDGAASVSLTMNGPKRMGPTIGLGATTSLNAAGGDQQSGVIGFGYTFKSNVNLEANYNQNNFRNTDDFTASGFVNYGAKYFYFGAGYSYLNVAGDHQIKGRIGFLLGRFVDFSVFADQTLESGGALTYGVSLRASF